MKQSLTYTAWLSLLGAALVWGAVGFLAWLVVGTEAERLARIQEREQELVQQELSLKLHAVVRDTRVEREALHSIATIDADRILDEVEHVAATAGVKLEVGQVLTTEPIENSLRITNIVITGSGTFARIMHAAALLESLPIPSTVAQVALDRGGETPQTPWRMAVHLRILTENDPSL